MNGNSCNKSTWRCFRFRSRKQILEVFVAVALFLTAPLSSTTPATVFLASWYSLSTRPGTIVQYGMNSKSPQNLNLRCSAKDLHQHEKTMNTDMTGQDAHCTSESRFINGAHECNFEDNGYIRVPQMLLGAPCAVLYGTERTVATVYFECVPLQRKRHFIFFCDTIGGTVTWWDWCFLSFHPSCGRWEETFDWFSQQLSIIRRSCNDYYQVQVCTKRSLQRDEKRRLTESSFRSTGKTGSNQQNIVEQLHQAVDLIWNHNVDGEKRRLTEPSKGRDIFFRCITEYIGYTYFERFFRSTFIWILYLVLLFSSSYQGNGSRIEKCLQNRLHRTPLFFIFIFPTWYSQTTIVKAWNTMAISKTGFIENKTNLWINFETHFAESRTIWSFLYS